MDILKSIIQRCHQRHEKPLRQRKTVITPALYKGLPYQFTVYCAHRYRVTLYDLEQADVSFMPIGRASAYDCGPTDSGGERFLKRQSIEDWEIRQWHQSWGIQVYTGIPSEQNSARWHDLNFTYQAICAAPDAVIACIETLANAVANPLLTLTKSGGLRFSCRVLEYLHANTENAKQYIYKHTPTVENTDQRDVYLEISGDKGYNRWDARYEILSGNLLDPPVISKEVLFAPINSLRSEIHEPAPSGQNRLNPVSQSTTVAPPFFDSHNLNLATAAFLKRGFFYVRENNGIYYWSQQPGKVDEEHVSFWEEDGTVWVRASATDTALPMETTPITDIWDDTGILPPIPTAGVSVSDEVVTVREGKLSPLAIKRASKTLQKSKDSKKVYGTLEENASQIQHALNENANILGLIAEKGAGKSYGAENYVLNAGLISLNTTYSVAEEVEQKFQRRNVPLVVRRHPRRYLWEQVKAIPVDVRMATPFQRGNVCEDPERCDALEKKGGDPRESICPECPVYVACQDRGYLSQPAALQRAQAQISGRPQLFTNPQYGEMVEEMLGQNLVLMSSTFTERDLREAFREEAVEAIRLKPTAWVAGNKVFQICTGIYEPETLLDNYANWNITGASEMGQRLFSGIRAEIERDLSVKHAIITYRPTIKQLTDVPEKENVCFVREFKELQGLETAFEEAEIVWIVGTPAWQPGIIWRRTQILFGNDEKPLSYETEVKPRRYKDERVQSVYEQHVAGLLTDIVGRAGLNHLSGKTVVLVTSFPLPDITDRPETLLFDWEDFEIAGGLDKLPEVIATREHFETERANLTADASRIEVERILGCSSRQANRVLNKLRGGNIPRVLFREQIFSFLANGEKKTSKLVEAIDGHPTSVRNELKRLVDADEIVKVR